MILKAPLFHSDGSVEAMLLGLATELKLTGPPAFGLLEPTPLKFVVTPAAFDWLALMLLNWLLAFDCLGKTLVNRLLPVAPAPLGLGLLLLIVEEVVREIMAALVLLFSAIVDFCVVAAAALVAVAIAVNATVLVASCSFVVAVCCLQSEIVLKLLLLL